MAAAGRRSGGIDPLLPLVSDCFEAAKIANFPKNERWGLLAAADSDVSSIDKWRGFSSANWRCR
jgi:hypothetical protein